jgi:hypothetical protein
LPPLRTALLCAALLCSALYWTGARRSAFVPWKCSAEGVRCRCGAPIGARSRSSAVVVAIPMALRRSALQEQQLALEARLLECEDAAASASAEFSRKQVRWPLAGGGVALRAVQTSPLGIRSGHSGGAARSGPFRHCLPVGAGAARGAHLRARIARRTCARSCPPRPPLRRCSRAPCASIAVECVEFSSTPPADVLRPAHQPRPVAL